VQNFVPALLPGAIDLFQGTDCRLLFDASSDLPRQALKILTCAVSLRNLTIKPEIGVFNKIGPELL
jgi:hypothetical protein